MSDLENSKRKIPLKTTRQSTHENILVVKDRVNYNPFSKACAAANQIKKTQAMVQERVQQQNDDRNRRAAARRQEMEQTNNDNLNEIFDPPFVENDSLNHHENSSENENVLNQAIDHNNSLTQDDDQPNDDGRQSNPIQELVTVINTANDDNLHSENETEVSSDFNSANESMGEGSGRLPAVTENITLTENPSENVQADPVTAKGKPMIKCPYCLKNGQTKWVEEKQGMNSHLRSAHRDLAAMHGLASTPAVARTIMLQGNAAQLSKAASSVLPSEGEGL